MSGPQFFHYLTCSRRRNRAGQCVDQVLGEAERIPEVSAHVALPRLPELVAGMPLPELRAAHDAMVAAASTTVRINGKVRHRAVRRDRHTLLAMVASYPLTWHQIGHYPYALAKLAEWEEATVAWARQQFGACFATAVRHRDEPYPHLHIFALPLGIEGVDATVLHAGKQAKRETLQRLKADGVPARDAVRAANIVYRQVMRELQDDYHRAVGEPCGLTRIGPGRQRLSRPEWKATKREAERQATRLAMLEVREAHTDGRQVEQDARQRDQDRTERHLEARETALGLAVTLVAQGGLQVSQGRVKAPPEHLEALRLIWPDIAADMVKLVALRDRWRRDITKIENLLARSDVPPDLRGEATRLIKDMQS